MKYLLVFLLIGFLTSCEDQTCSCTTVTDAADGTNISVVRDVVDTPDSGSCGDLYFFMRDPSSGITTTRNCQK